MNRIGVIAIWLVILIADGIIMPSLIRIPMSVGIIIFLSVFAVVFGIHRWVIGLGIVLAFLTEIILGTYFGIIITTWILMVWSWYIINHFISMKPMAEYNSIFAIVPLALFGFVLFVVGELGFWVVSRVFYESRLSFVVLGDILKSPIILISVIVETIVTLVLFRLIYKPHQSFYG